MIVVTDPRCTDYVKRGHPERPQRIAKAAERLRSQKDMPISWSDPLPVKDEQIARAHSKEFIASLSGSVTDFDNDTPAYPDIHLHARRSVGAALAALQTGRKGTHAFSLMRPPGHHATRTRAMGFCYLNSIAIAVLEARATGAEKVAVLDFDVHHGNGTEDILLGQPGCAFFSIHQHPAYPGTGLESRENCRNFTVPPEAPREAYRAACSKAFEGIDRFAPDLLAVSAGFDSYHADPLCRQNMEAEDFQWLGKTIHGMGRPSFSVLEGGYSTELPELVLAYLRGLEGL